MTSKDDLTAQPSSFALDNFVGDSAWAEAMRNKAIRYAKHEHTVLIVGPSGSGKTLLARSIHEHGRRRQSPLVPIDCATLSSQLFDLQFFGSLTPHSLGCFRAAHGGTILIDNVDRLTLVSQARLAEALQARQTASSADEPAASDARVIATSTIDLDAAASSGRFRLDLYSQLEGLVIRTVPLETRWTDIAQLANYFAAKATFELGLPAKRLSREAVTALESATWPGDVRQLQDTIEEAVSMCDGPLICAAELNLGPLGAQEGEERWNTLSEVEARHIRETLRICDGDLYRAARLLGVHVSHLRQKLSQHNIAAPTR